VLVGWISYSCYSHVISAWNHTGCSHWKWCLISVMVLVLTASCSESFRFKEWSVTYSQHSEHVAVVWWHWHLQEGCLEFERTKWYDTLILYGLKEGETEDGLKQDPDLRLVPVIIEKVLLPKLARKCLVHYDCHWQVVLVWWCVFYACFATVPPHLSMIF
jgi:hypothetical protein